MANPVWTGTLTFGLVALSVKMYSARERHGPTMHQFQKGTSDRVRYRRVNERTGKEVPPGETVRGALVEETDEYVMIEPEDVERIQPVRSKAMEVKSFIPADVVDPLWYASTYYLAPDKAASNPYRLLHSALEESGRLGLAKMIMRDREHLVLIGSQQGVLTASTLYWPDEIRDPEEVMRPPTGGELPQSEIDLARRLIDAMSGDWEPDTYRDEYEARLEEMIEAKARGGTVSYEEEKPAATGTVVDFAEAVRRSLDKQGRKPSGKRAPAPRKGGSTSRKASSSTSKTKKELREEAAELEVPGRSKMSRDELAEAVEHATG